MKLDRTVFAASWRSWLDNDRRDAGPTWMLWLWTLLFSAALALPFTLLGFIAFARTGGTWGTPAGWLYWYGRNLIVCATIAVAIHLLFDAGRWLFASPERVRRWRPWQRSLYFAGTPMLGVALGWPLGIELAGGSVRLWIGSRDGSTVVVGSVLISLLVGTVIHHYFAVKARQIDAEKRATEAQLRLLQAQIEPHFLFNTLANVQALIDHDTGAARQMLEAFTDYLRSSLATLRADQTTLAQELELAENYLRLLGARMADRLRYTVDADAAARAQRLPPLLLQPLVENAVQHGLEPTIAGGRVSIRARIVQRQLVIEVEDDGRGVAAPPRAGAGARRAGAGMALENIRQRLRARYGAAARLDISAADPGTLARITLPLEPPP